MECKVARGRSGFGLQHHAEGLPDFVPLSPGPVGVSLRTPGIEPHGDGVSFRGKYVPVDVPLRGDLDRVPVVGGGGDGVAEGVHVRLISPVGAVDVGEGARGAGAVGEQPPLPVVGVPPPFRFRPRRRRGPPR